jgi:hypothetical protein
MVVTQVKMFWFYKILFHCSGRGHVNRLETTSLECSTNKMSLEEIKLFY